MIKAETFEQFVQARSEQGDWGDYLSGDRTRLMRRKILEECNFPRSSLYQNPIVKRRLSEVEAMLRISGVLRESSAVPDMLLDEPGLIVAIAELSGRLGALQDRMRAIASLVQEIRSEIKTINEA